MFNRRATYWALYVLPLLWLGLFFVAPLVLMAAFSLRADMRGELLQSWTPTLKQYSALMATTSYWRLLGVSALMALVVATSATVLSYPIAYFLAFRAGRKAGRYLVLLLVPFWTSYLLRVMAWKIILGSDGVLNSLLSYLGVIDQPLTALLYNRNAVVITLIYVCPLQRCHWPPAKNRSACLRRPPTGACPCAAWRSLFHQPTRRTGRFFWSSSRRWASTLRLSWWAAVKAACTATSFKTSLPKPPTGRLDRRCR
jgi:ABC-type sugar transport system permease subunit